MKVGIYTLGCKVNTYESEFVTSLLENHGYQICHFDEVCDIYIINTCTVTNTSDIKSRKIIRRAKRKNPNACVIAMGCYIQSDKDNIIDEVDIAIGNRNKSQIVTLIETYFKDKQKINTLDSNFDETFEDMSISKYNNKTRAFVKIQDGCENFCSYCIIPFVRGRCRSKEFNKVIEEVTTLTKNGFKEIVLTGIHTGNYGTDINTNFAALLRGLVKIQGLERLRISSIEVNELTDEVLEIIKNNDVIVNHLHIPIQAASDHVLKLMNRKYDLQFFINKIKKIREIKKDISITTDIIVGHPGETNEDFEEGIKVLKQINFSKLHVFPYSKRNGTVAADMEQIDDSVKKKRARVLLNLSKELEINYMNNFIGKELNVLIEQNHDGYCVGHTTNYLNVKIYNQNFESETIVKVKLTKIEYPFVIGE